MPFLNFLYSNTLHVFNQLLIRRLDWLAIYLLFSCYFEPIVVANMPSRNTLVVGKGSFIEILVWENKAVFVPVKHFFFSLFSVFRNILASFTCIITFNYHDLRIQKFHLSLLWWVQFPEHKNCSLVGWPLKFFGLKRM